MVEQERKPFPGCQVRVQKKSHPMHNRVGGVVRETEQGNFVVRFTDSERVFSPDELTMSIETKPRPRREKDDDRPSVVLDFMDRPINAGDLIAYAKSDGMEIGRVTALIYFHGKDGVQVNTRTSKAKWSNKNAMMIVPESAIPAEMVPEG